MSDSLASSLGAKVPFKVNGKEYEIEPVGLGILADAEVEMRRRMMPWQEEVAGISVMAEVNRDLAKELYEEARQRRESLPPEEVIQWVSRDLQGVVYTIYRQFLESHPQKFDSGELSRKDIERAVYNMAQKNLEEFEKFVAERNQASDLEEIPENPSQTPASQEKGPVPAESPSTTHSPETPVQPGPISSGS